MRNFLSSIISFRKHSPMTRVWVVPKVRRKNWFSNCGLFRVQVLCITLIMEGIGEEQMVHLDSRWVACVIWWMDVDRFTIYSNYNRSFISKSAFIVPLYVTNRKCSFRYVIEQLDFFNRLFCLTIYPNVL